MVVMNFFCVADMAIQQGATGRRPWQDCYLGRSLG
jgi:hypothetical protein